MSMKRTRQKSYSPSRRNEADAPSRKNALDKEWRWEEHVSYQPDSAFVPYSMQSKYKVGDFLLHSKFGKGVVISVEAARMDVLFMDGRKKLGQGLP